MSVNKFYDVIEDEIVRMSEPDDDTEVSLPSEFTVRLAKDEMEAILKAGLFSAGERLPITADSFRIVVIGHSITFVIEAPENTPETIH